MSAWTEEEGQAALRDILRRAAADAEFRELCLKSPAEAVKEATGRDLPEDFQLRLVENKGADLTLVLPDPVSSTELADSDLEGVAGGAGKNANCGVSKVCGVSKGTDPKPIH